MYNDETSHQLSSLEFWFAYHLKSQKISIFHKLEKPSASDQEFYH